MSRSIVEDLNKYSNNVHIKLFYAKESTLKHLFIVQTVFLDIHSARIFQNLPKYKAAICNQLVYEQQCFKSTIMFQHNTLIKVEDKQLSISVTPIQVFSHEVVASKPQL